MNRVEELNRRYKAIESLARLGATLISVDDPEGRRFDEVLWTLICATREDDPVVWEDLLGAARSLRWKRLTQPRPVSASGPEQAVGAEIRLAVSVLRRSTSVGDILTGLQDATWTLLKADAPVSQILLRSVREVGVENCTLLASNRAAQAALQDWWPGIQVLTPHEIAKTGDPIDTVYAVGPPQIFPTTVTAAAATGDLQFVVPDWFRDRTVPRSALSSYAEGFADIAIRVNHEGASLSSTELGPAAAEVELQPQPAWTPPTMLQETAVEKVAARKVLLAGNLAIWLDNGDRIRSLDPDQPSHERIIYLDIADVKVGSYLLLRDGESEHGALFGEAIHLLKNTAESVADTQRSWKSRLQSRLDRLGIRDATGEMLRSNIITADRARAWVDEHLIRPQSDNDFRSLLDWLQIPLHPTFENANALRRALSLASSQRREELEHAFTTADLAVLHKDGSLRVDGGIDGLRGMIATRVLAISPHTELIARHDLRVPFGDKGGRWLE